MEAHDIRLPEEVLAVASRGPADPVDPLTFEHDLLETGALTIDEHWWRARAGAGPS